MMLLQSPVKLSAKVNRMNNSLKCTVSQLTDFTACKEQTVCGEQFIRALLTR